MKVIQIDPLYLGRIVEAGEKSQRTSPGCLQQ